MTGLRRRTRRKAAYERWEKSTKLPEAQEAESPGRGHDTKPQESDEGSKHGEVQNLGRKRTGKAITH
jgi:hypothetical protein